MNKQQLEWAKQHDWFIESWVNAYNSYSILVKDDLNAGETKVFGHQEFKELKEWAGY